MKRDLLFKLHTGLPFEFHFVNIKTFPGIRIVLRIFLIPRQISKYKKADERQVWCIASVNEAGGCRYNICNGKSTYHTIHQDWLNSYATFLWYYFDALYINTNIYCTKFTNVSDNILSTLLYMHNSIICEIFLKQD